jgi:hypothetical protein
MNVSQESPLETESRLKRVLQRAEVHFYEEAFQFKESSVATEARSVLDHNALALIRDGDVVSQLVPMTPTCDHQDAFGLFRIHFPAEVDNSGFVGWLASLLKARFGTGVVVICGQNSTRGGIFDYWGCPFELRARVFEEIRRLRSLAPSVGGLDLQGRRFRVLQNDEGGEADLLTVFHFRQDGNLVSADYHGGRVRAGRLLGVLQSDSINFHYVQANDRGQIRTGQATDTVHVLPDGRLRLVEQWEWTGESHDHKTGTLVLEEF